MLTILAIIASAVAVCLFLGFVLWFLYARILSSIKYSRVVESPNFEKFLKLNAKDLWVATAGYDHKNITGRGPSSVVYKGRLADGKLIAVKKMNIDEENREAQSYFMKECEILCKVKHRNLVKILGAVQDSKSKTLVYELMHNRSLDVHLYRSDVCKLSWETRLRIATGVAEALVYLHEECGIGEIVHCGVKGSNILLDQDFEAHLSDFGIANVIHPQHAGAVLSAAVCGNPTGYTAPEAMYGEISSKLDVYSYGVILFEILMKKTPVGTSLPMIEWIKSLSEESAMEVIDGTLKESATYEQILSLLNLGLLCTQMDPNDRPSMRQVVKMLRDIKYNKPFAELVRNYLSHLTLEDGRCNKRAEDASCFSSGYTTQSSLCSVIVS